MIDLHMHSIFSDGTLTPEELVEAAVELELKAISLTDHDTVSGVGRMIAAAENTSVQVIPGVEIGADFGPGTMHILGYFVDFESRMLHDHLDWIRNGRETRNEEIFRKLHMLGMPLTWEEIKEHAGDEMIGRPHFALAMIKKGYVYNLREAFDKFLAKKRPAYAERKRLSPEASIELIRSAGGVAVLAHPYSLELGKRETKKVVRWLAEAGLGGIEVYYTNNDRVAIKQFGKLAREYDLVATGGSDFHGTTTPDVSLGTGTGNLKVPDEVVEQLEAKRPRV